MKLLKVIDFILGKVSDYIIYILVIIGFIMIIHYNWEFRKYNTKEALKEYHGK